MRASRDGKTVHLGRFKSKLAAAVCFSRHILGTSNQPAVASAVNSIGFGNLIVMPDELPDSMDGGKKNTIEKILDLRVNEIFQLAPPSGAHGPSQPLRLTASAHRRSNSNNISDISSNSSSTSNNSNSSNSNNISNSNPFSGDSNACGPRARHWMARMVQRTR